MFVRFRAQFGLLLAVQNLLNLLIQFVHFFDVERLVFLVKIRVVVLNSGLLKGYQRENLPSTDPSVRGFGLRRPRRLGLACARSAGSPFPRLVGGNWEAIAASLCCTSKRLGHSTPSCSLGCWQPARTGAAEPWLQVAASAVEWQSLAPIASKVVAKAAAIAARVHCLKFSLGTTHPSYFSSF